MREPSRSSSIPVAAGPYACCTTYSSLRQPLPATGGSSSAAPAVLAVAEPLLPMASLSRCSNGCAR